MPRRNFAVLITLAVVSLVCYQKVQTNHFGRILTDAMDQIDSRSLEEVDQHSLFEGAMEGMVDRLDDPYSSYVGREVVSEFRESLDQQFAGVGMQVDYDESSRLTVMSPLVGSPAYVAGVRAGDKILRIDGRSTQGLSRKDAVGLLRGKPGEPVTISVLHEGEQQPVDIEIVRAIIHLDTVLGDTHEPDGTWNFFVPGHDRIGYVRISNFAEKTPDELRAAMQWLIQRNMRGLILDLRDDPGGLLTAAADVCDMFIDSGVIVTTRGRDGKISQAIEATPDGSFGDFPMAVLVNQFSASASEIVAACLQDHGRAVVVGQRTWGKGTVQDVIELPDDEGILKLTIASYWRPSGKNIHRTKKASETDEWGVKPDTGCQVVVEGDELVKLHQWRLRRDVFRPAANGKTPDGAAPNGKTPDGKTPDGTGIDPLVDRQLEKAVECVETAIGNPQPSRPAAA